MSERPRKIAKAAPAKRGNVEKSVEKTPKQTPIGVAMMPAGNGGMLKVGNPGNAGGTGRPPSEIRRQLRGAFADRVSILENIAEGHPTQTIEVPIASLLAYAECPKCKGELLTWLTASQQSQIQVKVKASATPRDQMTAMDLLAKYGLGTTQEVTGEDGVPLHTNMTVRFVKPEGIE